MGKSSIKDELKFSSHLKLSTSCIVTVFSIAFLIVFFLIWSYFHTINLSSVAIGHLDYFDSIYRVESQDQGIVYEFFVSNDSKVSKGQPIVKIIKEQDESDYQSILLQNASSEATLLRLSAVIHNRPLNFPAYLKKSYPDLVENESRLYDIDTKALEEAKKILNHQKRLTLEEFSMIKPLVDEGTLSQTENLNMKKKLSDIQSKLYNLEHSFYQKMITKYGLVSARLVLDKEKLKVLKLKMSRNILHAPIAGTIHDIRVKQGDVLERGETLMTILPIESPLVVQAKLSPSDIGFVHVGQEVSIHLDAYDYAIYGGISGVVDKISTHAIEEDNDVSYYKLTITLNPEVNKKNLSNFNLRPGMTVTANIVTAKISFLSYLLVPILKTYIYGFSQR